MTRPYDRTNDSPDALTDGAWRFDPWRRVQVWVEAPGARPAPIDTSLIACTFCHARMDQSCRTSKGAPCNPHAQRHSPRVCPCGSELLPMKRLCSPCAEESTRTKNRGYRERQAARLATVTTIHAQADELEDVAS